MTWGVTTGATPVVTLSGLARALGTTRPLAAKALLTDPRIAQSAPASLVAEAREIRGEARTVEVGAFVEVGGVGVKGRVDLLVQRGSVPGFDGVVGTKARPVVRVAEWRDGRATGRKVAAPLADVKHTEPLDLPARVDTPAARLVRMVTEQNDRVAALRLPEHRKVTGAAVKAAYQRGVRSWPEGRTTLSMEEWGVGRAAHLVKVANGQIASPAAAGLDRDLLDARHPLYVSGDPVDPDAVTVDRSAIDEALAGIKSALDQT